MGYFQQPYALRWRKALFQVHLWIGVIIGLYVIAICASGCVLVFEQSLLNDRPQLAQSACPCRARLATSDSGGDVGQPWRHTQLHRHALHGQAHRSCGLEKGG